MGLSDWARVVGRGEPRDVHHAQFEGPLGWCFEFVLARLRSAGGSSSL
jgi:hypothetical protein